MQLIYLPWSKHIYFCRNTLLPPIPKEELGFSPLTQTQICINSCASLIISEKENSLYKLKRDLNLLTAVCYEQQWIETKMFSEVSAVLLSHSEKNFRFQRLIIFLFFFFLVPPILFFSCFGHISVMWYPWLFGTSDILNLFYTVTYLEFSIEITVEIFQGHRISKLNH